MPHLPGSIRLLALLGVLVAPLACYHGRLDTPPERVVTMEFDGSDLEVPDTVEVRWNQRVRWRSADPDAVWVIVFADSTPFRGANPRRVFNGAGPGASDNGAQLPRAPAGAPDGAEYKYWIFYPGGPDGYLVVDPKLVIRR